MGPRRDDRLLVGPLSVVEERLGGRGDQRQPHAELLVERFPVLRVELLQLRGAALEIHLGPLPGHALDEDPPVVLDEDLARDHLAELVEGLAALREDLLEGQVLARARLAALGAPRRNARNR